MSTPTTPHTRYIVDTLYKIYKEHRHVAVKIETAWGTMKCHELFQRYLAKDREHRNGFSPEVYQLLVSLYTVHESQYGDYNQPLVIIYPNINLTAL